MKNKTHIINNNLFLLKEVAAASPWRIPLELLSMISGCFFNVLVDVYLLRFVINGIQNGMKFQNIVFFLLFTLIYMICCRLFFSFFYNAFVPISDAKIYKRIQKKLFYKSAEVEIGCYENPEFYDKYVKAISEASGRTLQVLNSFNNIVGCIFTFSTLSFLIFYIEPALFLFALIPLVINLLFGKRLNKLQYKYNMEMQEKSRRRDYTRRVFYLTDYAKELRMTNVQNIMFREFRAAISELKKTIKKHSFKIGALDYILISSQDLIVFLGTILFVAYKTMISKTMLFGDCVIIITTINYISWALRDMVNIYMQFHNNSLYIENLQHFLRYESKISDKGSLDIPHKAIISLRNVSFQYDGCKKPVLKNICFDIHPNEKIALVGHNGAGKSTLIKLILRLYDVTKGNICLGGTPIQAYDLKKYRDLFGVVFQDYKIFSLCVTDNVLLKDHITDKDWKVAMMSLNSSGIANKISSLKDKENTILTREFSDDGVVLSGGENQKIAIARVFAKPCDIVILDEPSSALDPIAEYQMYEAMMKACKDKIVILISHRLSSAVLADTVYLMENGEITERGSHHELLIQNGKYADMWRKQAEKYKMEVINE